MTPLNTDRLLPMFFLSLMVMLLSIAIPTARANPELIEAIKNNDSEKIQKLIEDGVDINQSIDIIDENYERIIYPLRLAAIHGSSEVVRLLIQNGTDLEFAIDSALDGAARFGQLEIVRMLIEEYNANYLPGYGKRFYGEASPLHYAASGGHLDIIEYLSALAPELVNHEAYYNTPLQTVFHCSYDGDNQNVIELLLERGANPNLNGEDLLRSAIWMSNTRGFTLIFNHPGFNRDLINMPDRDRHGQTPLQLALDRGNQEIIALLIQHGVISPGDNQQDEATGIPGQTIEHEATPVEQTVTISDDPVLTTTEQANTSLSINAESNSTMEMASSETLTSLEELSLNESENTTVTLGTLPSITPGMSLVDFLPPTSH